MDLKRRHPAVHRSVCDETDALRSEINVFVNDANMRSRDGMDTAIPACDRAASYGSNWMTSALLSPIGSLPA
jgi:hypothetical protein